MAWGIALLVHSQPKTRVSGFKPRLQAYYTSEQTYNMHSGNRMGVRLTLFGAIYLRVRGQEEADDEG